MRAVRATAPLRISLAGGGTDVPWYYQPRAGGNIVATAIDLYSRVLVEPSSDGKWKLTHERETTADSLSELAGASPITAACLARAGCADPVHITSSPDVPSGTGMGSSGAYGVSLLAALSALSSGSLPVAADSWRSDLAEAACAVEMTDLALATGKQDQYMAAFGGLRTLRIERDGVVEVGEPKLSAHTSEQLEKRLMLFALGGQRSAHAMLAAQRGGTPDSAEATLTNLDRIRAMADETLALFAAGDLDGFGLLMHEHWQRKQERLGGVDPRIVELYEICRSAGALGGKLVGAGGTGYLLAYSPRPDPVRAAMQSVGIAETPFRFAQVGVQVAKAE